MKNNQLIKKYCIYSENYNSTKLLSTVEAASYIGISVELLIKLTKAKNIPMSDTKYAFYQKRYLDQWLMKYKIINPKWLNCLTIHSN